MTRRALADLPASVHDRLLRQAKERGEDFSFTLVRYGIERLLYRLTATKHARRFVLKGAILLAAWHGQPHRPTKDVDLLGYAPNSAQVLTSAFREICLAHVVPDGLDFDGESIRVEEIREEQEYGGQRINLVARLGKAPIHLQIDVAFGDAVTPEPAELDYPALLDFPAPRPLAYPRESVVAEKLQAMVDLGMANSRMKDYYDVAFLAKRYEFEGRTLTRAIRATFDQRGTTMPIGVPTALSDDFATDAAKARQ